MAEEHQLLIINVGSTSTKLACFRGESPFAQENILYSAEDLTPFSFIGEQLSLRREGVTNFLRRNAFEIQNMDIIVSRGGLGQPLPAGAYKIDETMCHDLLAGTYGNHASALGPAMALDISRKYGIPAIVIDPPSTDEFEALARISGIPEIERKSAFHALNQKAAARNFAFSRGKKYEEINVVVAHLGGGITIGAHRRGRVIDCTHGLTEGPFTPERAGSLPTLDLLELIFSGKTDKHKIQERLAGKGGLAAYLDTTDARNVEKRIAAGDEKARLIYEAMAYQIAKDIGSMAAVLAGKIEGIILTGGMAHSAALTDLISARVRFLAPVFVYPGEDEISALAAGGLRVLRHEEEIKIYGSSV